MKSNKPHSYIEKEGTFGGSAPVGGEAAKICPYCNGAGYIVEPKIKGSPRLPCAKCGATGQVKA